MIFLEYWFSRKFPHFKCAEFQTVINCSKTVILLFRYYQLDTSVVLSLLSFNGNFFKECFSANPKMRFNAQYRRSEDTTHRQLVVLQVLHKSLHGKEYEGDTFFYFLDNVARLLALRVTIICRQHH